MSQNLLQASGAQSQKQPKFVPIHTPRFISGLYTNRSFLRGPLDSLYTDFYHMGQTDVLCGGLNSEVSARSTMIRRPGNPPFSTFVTAAAIDAFYSFHQSNGTINVIADSSTDVEVITPTSGTSIFTKTSGAGEGYFLGIDQTLYIVDGIDTVKYIPGTTNPLTGKPVWNLAGAAPTDAPTMIITETGSAGVPWVASTEWTTMGLLVDPNGNVQQLTSVNASGTNATQLGTTGTGNPVFPTTPGGSVTDNTITWTNFGPIVAWSAGTTYDNITPSGGTLANPCIIYDPVSDSCYVNAAPGNAQGTSSSIKPHFTGVFASVFHDGSVKWFCLGTPKVPALWKPGHAYPAIGTVSNNDGVSVISTPVTPETAGIGSANAQQIFLMASSGGTSGAGGVAPFPTNAVVGTITTDGDMIWTCLGTATRANNTTYIPWSAGQPFSVIKDANGNLQVCLSSTGPSGVSAPTFATIYGQTTQDGINAGTVNFVGTTWVCVGTSLSWAASTQWYLPTSGFVPPSPSQPYGGATLVDSNGNNQYVINSGLSGGSVPSWGALGTDTTDNAVTWHAVSAFTAAGFSWVTDKGYVFAFKSRKSTDVYVTTAPPLQIPGTNSPNITGPLGPPTGAGDGTVSTASPVLYLKGGNVGAQILLSGKGSTDPQFDTIEIYRAADGFGASGPYLFLTDIPMPPPVGNQPGVWQIIDFMPDVATSLLPGLNPLLEAPIDHLNDPAPGEFGSTQFIPVSAANPTQPAPGTALIGIVAHQNRSWGFIDNAVFASLGPDIGTGPGNQFTAWPPTNVFPFQSNVTRLLPTSSGLLVFTTTDLYVIAGGPALTDYVPSLLVPGLGLLSWNAVTVIGGVPYLFTADRQFLSVDPTSGVTRIGHPIGDKLAQFDPSQTYVTYHSFGDLDHALFISDGSTQWYRCDPNPTPDGKYTGPVWSPRATVSGGLKAIQSIVTSAGVTQLLIGPPAAGKILARDSTFASFVDNTTAYDANFIIGNVTLAHPGQMAQMEFMELDFNQIGTQPVVSILFDEIAPSVTVPFEVISTSIVTDPPKLYGKTGTPQTLWMNRYYFGQTIPGNAENEPQPAWCKSFQLMVDFGNTDTIQNELFAFTCYAALWAEG